jgi:hypothetical protein
MILGVNMACENHAELIRRLAEHDTRMDLMEAAIQSLQIGAAAKDEQIKTVFNILGEIKQMLKDYTVEMKGAIVRLSNDIEAMKSRPGKFVDSAIAAGIAATIGAIIGYIVRSL